MKRSVIVTAVAVLSLVTAAPAFADGSDDGSSAKAAAASSSASASGAKATYIVEFTAGTDNDAEADDARANGATVQHQYRNAINGMAVELTPGQLARLKADPNVKRIEADGVVTALDVQNPATWGLDRSDQRSLPLDSSYTYSTTASNVTAYIIDTGILAGHSEFGGRVAAGFDAVTTGGAAVDCNGHGTHVAGTVGGSTYGLAKGVKLVPVRVLDCTGSGTWAGVVAGLDWAVADHQAGVPAVANMSLGGGANQTVDDAVARLVADGVTVAVAAGNSNVDACTTSPARTPSAITVGATDSTDARASFSNFGTCLDIFAPGVNITSSWFSSTTATNTISGTSMATPHVVGAAALWLATHPSDTPAQVTAALTGNATPGIVGGPGTGSPNRLLYVGTAAVPPTPAPTVTSLSATSGYTGTAVTITGTNLTGATAVSFNGAAATFTVASATSITTTVPATATTGPVTVTTGGGTATGPTFTVTPKTAPAAPTGVTATASTTAGRATVRWTRPTNTGGSALTSQTVVGYRVSTGARTTYTVSASATSVTLTGLVSGQSYQFAVIATNAIGSSPESARSTAITVR